MLYALLLSWQHLKLLYNEAEIELGGLLFTYTMLEFEAFGTLCFGSLSQRRCRLSTSACGPSRSNSVLLYLILNQQKDNLFT